MRRNAERLQQLIDQLLDLAKLENGSMSLQLSKGDVFLSCGHSFTVLKAWQRCARYTFKPNFLRAVHFIILTGTNWKKIVTNLLSNAFKFTPTLGKVFVRAQLEKGRLKVTIEDSGNGIPPEELEKYLNGFTRWRVPRIKVLALD